LLYRTGMNDSPHYRPERDRRISDSLRFLHDRRLEAEHMIALWERSPKLWPADELAHWRAVLADVTRKIARLEAGDLDHGGHGMDTDQRLRYDVLTQVICHRRYRSTVIADALGEPHARVVAAMRDLERLGGFPLDQAVIASDDAVEVVEDLIADDLRITIRRTNCPDAAGSAPE